VCVWSPSAGRGAFPRSLLIQPKEDMMRKRNFLFSAQCPPCATHLVGIFMSQLQLLFRRFQFTTPLPPELNDRPFLVFVLYFVFSDNSNICNLFYPREDLFFYATPPDAPPRALIAATYEKSFPSLFDDFPFPNFATTSRPFPSSNPSIGFPFSSTFQGLQKSPVLFSTEIPMNYMPFLRPSPPSAGELLLAPPNFSLKLKDNFPKTCP